MGAGTVLEYTGELAADFWLLARWWGERVGRGWEAAVAASLAGIAQESERRASAGR